MIKALPVFSRNLAKKKNENGKLDIYNSPIIQGKPLLHSTAFSSTVFPLPLPPSVPVHPVRSITHMSSARVGLFTKRCVVQLSVSDSYHNVRHTKQLLKHTHWINLHNRDCIFCKATHLTFSLECFYAALNIL